MKINVNGTDYEVQSEDNTPLLWVLRDELGFTGTKYGCGVMQCGACTVLIDGEVKRSCSLPVSMVGEGKIMTVEGAEGDAEGAKVVDAWVANNVPQCGYCQSGQVLTATALLKRTSTPTDDDISAAMVNLCRCGTYNAIADAVKLAAES